MEARDRPDTGADSDDGSSTSSGDAWRLANEAMIRPACDVEPDTDEVVSGSDRSSPVARRGGDSDGGSEGSCSSGRSTFDSGASAAGFPEGDGGASDSGSCASESGPSYSGSSGDELETEDEQEAMIRMLFEQLDTKGEGFLAVEALEASLRNLGLAGISDQVISEFMVGSEDPGRVGFERFAACFRRATLADPGAAADSASGEDALGGSQQEQARWADDGGGGVEFKSTQRQQKRDASSAHRGDRRHDSSSSNGGGGRGQGESRSRRHGGHSGRTPAAASSSDGTKLGPAPLDAPLEAPFQGLGSESKHDADALAVLRVGTRTRWWLSAAVAGRGGQLRPLMPC